MIRVCIVKQHTTYDLFTCTGPDLRAIVASSNWRSGPLGLWEAFETTARIVYEDGAPECQIGRRHWSNYVEGWDIWPAGSTAEAAEAIDWDAYDVVISIDVAVPSRVVARFPGVMWCYYFIEGGPTGIEGPFRGSPYYGYNVFFNHRLAQSRLTPASPTVRQMSATRRTVLDFPYYMQSSSSVSRLYPELAAVSRAGVCLSHHSRQVSSAADLAALAKIGPVRTEWTSISDIHRAELQSRYFVVHPDSVSRAGLGVIEAVSAGCLVLAPSQRLWGFPELVIPELNFTTFDELIALLGDLEADPRFAAACRARQQALVEEWCYASPAHNLELVLQAFRSSRATPDRQRRAEDRARLRASAERAGLRMTHRLRRTLDFRHARETPARS
jgi:hypothetical protein